MRVVHDDEITTTILLPSNTVYGYHMHPGSSFMHWSWWTYHIDPQYEGPGPTAMDSH